MPESSLRLLQLLQLSDSAVPIGAASHSYGQETLAAEGLLDVPKIGGFLSDLLQETGSLEGGFCLAAYRLATSDRADDSRVEWRRLNERVAAFKPARESRAASAALGRRLLYLAVSLGDPTLLPLQRVLLDSGPRSDIHHAAAFGLVCGYLRVDPETAVAAFLHQLVAGYVSAFQRLLPLGQSEAARLLWSLKPALDETARAVCAADDAPSEPCCFTPLLDWASMRHPTLETRLFIS